MCHEITLSLFCAIFERDKTLREIITFLQVVSGPIKLVQSLVFIKRPVKMIMLLVNSSQWIFSSKCALTFLENSESIGY